MNRRQLFRDSLIGIATVSTVAATTAGAREFPPGSDASKDLAKADWKPIFLDAHQNETLILLSELIVPGSKDALVNRFLDLQMSIEKPATQHAFTVTLSYIEGLSRDHYHSAFLHATPQQQNDLLHLIAYPHSLVTWGESTGEFIGYEHFRKLKRWIADAYYTSPAGLKELGWDGSFPHGQLTGCADHKA